MASIDKSTITIKSSAAIMVTVIGLVGDICGNYWATRSAVSVEINQIKNDIRYEALDRKSADKELESRIANNSASITRLEQAIKPGTVTTYR